MKYLFPLFALVLLACSGQTKSSDADAEKIRDEVRNYLFLSDSVEVATNITDTILVEELDGMLATIEDNLYKIQLDIDTLNTMIDDLAYLNLEKDQEINAVHPDKVNEKKYDRDTKLLNYQLKMAHLNTKKMSFQQTKRVMLHLRRSQLNSIAGYEITASYSDREHEIQLAFIMNADFKIID